MNKNIPIFVIYEETFAKVYFGQQIQTVYKYDEVARTITTPLVEMLSGGGNNYKI